MTQFVTQHMLSVLFATVAIHILHLSITNCVSLHHCSHLFHAFVVSPSEQRQ